MIDFTFADGHYTYRPLRLVTPILKGWDVYALQTVLEDIGFNIAIDGFLGEQTGEAILRFQEWDPVLADDGIAGIATQRALAVRRTNQARTAFQLPGGLLYGQVESECGWQIGNYTAPYPDGTRDCGIVQRNTRYADPVDGFDVGKSVDVLGRQLAAKHLEYVNVGTPSQRAWDLAAGSWNRPAWTDALARGQTSVKVGGEVVDLRPGSEARTWIENYIDRVTAYTAWNKT